MMMLDFEPRMNDSEGMHLKAITYAFSEEATVQECNEDWTVLATHQLSTLNDQNAQVNKYRSSTMELILYSLEKAAAL